jgi:hypothetical protein
MDLRNASSGNSLEIQRKFEVFRTGLSEPDEYLRNKRRPQKKDGAAPEGGTVFDGVCRSCVASPTV